METKLKTYMGCVLDECSEGAILIFAHSAKEAKKVGWREPSFIHDMCNGYIDFRVTLMKDADHLFKEAKQDKLAANIPHVIDSPRTCDICLMWGEPINEKGLCESCAEDEDDCEHEWFFPSNQAGELIRRCSRCGVEQQKMNEFWKDLK